MADSTSNKPGAILRQVQTFVRREGRATAAQNKALEELLPRWQWPELCTPPDNDFGRAAPTFLEIGFGAGENLLAQCQAHPEINFLGLEVHRPGVGQLLHKAGKAGLTNLRVSPDDALQLLRERLPEACIDRIQVWFPDPWHKRRHNKRRIIQSKHLDLMARVLKPGGQLLMATDWEDYAAWMLNETESHPAFRNLHGPRQFAPRCDDRVLTRFEARGLRLGHIVRDLAYERINT